MEEVPGSSKMNEVDSQDNRHKYFLETQARFQSALEKFQNDIKLFNEFRDLLVVSFPSLRRQIPKTTSIVRSSSAPSILLSSSEQLHVSLLPVTSSSQRVSKGHRKNVKITESRDAQASSSLQRSSSNSQGGYLRNDNSVQDSGFGIETSSKGCASPGVQRTLPAVNEEQDELWNLLDATRNKGTTLVDRINFDATRTETKYIEEEEEEDDVTKLRREKGEILNRIAKLEEDATRSNAFVQKLQKQFDDLTKIRNELQEHLLDESASKLHKDESASDPDLIELLSIPGNNTGVPCGSTTISAIVSETIDKIKFRNSTTDKTVATQVEPANFQLGPDETSVKIQRGKLGSLDDALAFPKEVIKVEDIDTAKILAILGERSYLELQRHLIIAIIRNQILERKLDQIQIDYNYLTKRFQQLSQMNRNLCKELTEQLKELHGARLKIMELMQLVPLAELKVEMKNEEKNPKSIPTLISTPLPGRREISQPVPVPGAYTPPRQIRTGTRKSSTFMSRSYSEPQHSSYNLARSNHDTGTGESLNKSLPKGSEKSGRFFEKVTRTQEALKKRLGHSSRDAGNRSSLENTRHSVETEIHKTRLGSPLSIGPSDYRSDDPDPTATGTESNETRGKLFSWKKSLK